jgi:osmotically-inducible protein OsmY
MAEDMISIVARPDEDIEEDIHRELSGYPPLRNDRHRVHIDVREGVVTIKGYVKVRMTADYILTRIANVRGVRAVRASELYHDDTIRLDAGRMIPPGVFVNVEYGAVILSGRLPQDAGGPVESGANMEMIVRRIASISGVNRVITAMDRM